MLHVTRLRYGWFYFGMVAGRGVSVISYRDSAGLYLVLPASCSRRLSLVFLEVFWGLCVVVFDWGSRVMVF